MTGPLVLSGDPAGDLEATTKQYVDNHTSDVVLYTPQTLTDEQKTQARGNINAAPGGFGIGANGYPYAYTVLTASTINSVDRSGLYVYDDANNTLDTGLDVPGSTVGGTYGKTGLLLHLEHTVAHSYDAKQVFYPRAPMSNTYLERVKDTDKGWQPWEYVNPPMATGVEYRTTERYLGKPVYAKLIDCGKFPAPASSKQIAHGISDCYPIRVTGQMSNSNTVPWAEGYSIGADNTIIRLYAAPNVSDQSGTNTVALIHYTKTTD